MNCTVCSGCTFLHPKVLGPVALPSPTLHRFLCAALVHSPACLLKCPLSWEAFTGLFNYLQLAKGLCCFILSFVCRVSTIPIQKTAIRIFGCVTDFFSPFILLFIYRIFPFSLLAAQNRFSFIFFFLPLPLEI